MPIISQITTIIERGEFNRDVDIRPWDSNTHISDNKLHIYVNHLETRYKATIFLTHGTRYHRCKATFGYLTSLGDAPIADVEILEQIITLPSGEMLDIFLERDDYRELSKGNRSLTSLFRWLETSPLMIDDLTLEDIYQDGSRAIICNLDNLSINIESDSNIEPEISVIGGDYSSRYFCNSQYLAAGGWNEGCLVMQDRKSGLYGIVDESERLIADFIYDQIDDLYEGHAPIMLSGKWGVINCKGEYLLSPEYDDIEMLWEVNYIKYGRDGLYGLLTRDILVVCDAKYRYIGSFYSGCALVEFEDGGYNYIDNQGIEINHERYISAEPFKESLAKVSTQESTFYIDCNGEFVCYETTL